MDKESDSSDVGVGIGQIEEGVRDDGANGCTRSLKPPPPPPPPSSPSPSPTSQFEYDNGIDSTYQALAFDSLYKSYSNALMDEEETTSSEESLPVHHLKRDDEESFSSLSSNAISSTSNRVIHKNNKKEAEDTGFSEFIDNVFSFSPSSPAAAGCSPTDFMFCRLECGGFPGMVEDVDTNLSNDLHNLIIRGGGDEVGGLNILNDWILLNEQVGAGDKQGEGGVDEREDEEGGEKVIEEGQIHFKIAEDEEVFDEHGKGKDDDEEEALLLLENASNRCSPEVEAEATLALKKDEMLPTN